MSANLALFDPLRSLAFGSILSTYVAIGTPFPNTIRSFRIINDTDGKLIISTNSSVAAGHIFLVANSFVLYDITANSGPNDPLRLPNLIQWYVKYVSAPMAGTSVYIEGMYGKGE